jgi:hypothetical protein
LKTDCALLGSEFALSLLAVKQIILSQSYSNPSDGFRNSLSYLETNGVTSLEDLVSKGDAVRNTTVSFKGCFRPRAAQYSP